MDDEPAWGLVLDGSRLSYALIHGESLVACAVFALSAAEVTVVDARLDWETVVEAEVSLVLHDAACPMTPAAFIAHCVELAGDGVAVAGVRPVTDTVKRLDGDHVGETVDRAGLRAICSPLVLPPEVVATLDGWPGDIPTLVHALAARGVVRLEAGPPEIRRVASEDDVRVLEALTRP